MKGPQERLKYDLRRLWECPVCKRRERVAASQTFRFCNCQMKQADGKPVVMKLIQDGVQRLTPVIAVPKPAQDCGETAMNSSSVPTPEVGSEQPILEA